MYSAYFIKRSLLCCFVSILFITALLWLTQSFRLFDLIVVNGVSILDFFKISMYSLPLLIFSIMPIAVLIGFLVEICRARQDKELLILQSVGRSNFAIAKPFLLSSIILSILCYTLSFYILPKSHQLFKQQLFEIQHKYMSVTLDEGAFSNNIKGLTIYIAKKYPDGAMGGILINDVRDQDKGITIIAKYGKIEQTDTGINLLVRDGERQEYNYQTNHTNVMKFDRYFVNLNLLEMITESKDVAQAEMYIHELISNKALVNNYIIHGHKRIIWPFYCLSLMIIPLAILLRSHHNRYISSYKNTLSITCLSIAMVIIATNIEHIAAKHLYLIPLMYCNAAWPILIGLKALRRSA